MTDLNQDDHSYAWFLSGDIDMCMREIMQKAFFSSPAEEIVLFYTSKYCPSSVFQRNTYLSKPR
jgi:hypothetical protein